MEVSRSLASQFLLLSVEAARRHETRTKMVKSGSCIEQAIRLDDRFWDSLFLNKQLIYKDLLRNNQLNVIDFIPSSFQ